MSYLLDSNVFITAKNLHYGFDFCPAFWEWVVRAHDAGKVSSIDKVADEIQAHEDELSEWATELQNGFFLEEDASILPALNSVSEWARGKNYSDAAINTFFQIADYYLVAHALAGGHTIVTHERPADSINRIKIPNACIDLGVKYLTPFDMLRRERARFVLKGA